MDRLIKRVFFIKEVHLLAALGPVESKLLVRIFKLAAIRSLFLRVDYLDSSFGILYFINWILGCYLTKYLKS